MMSAKKSSAYMRHAAAAAAHTAAVSAWHARPPPPQPLLRQHGIESRGRNLHGRDSCRARRALASAADGQLVVAHTARAIMSAIMRQQYHAGVNPNRKNAKNFLCYG